MDEREWTYIKVPYPKGRDLHAKVHAPIGSLAIAPGLGNAWVTGQHHDPKLVVPVCIKQSENSVEIIAVGAFAYRTPPRWLPRLKLSFGRSRPFSLSIKAGHAGDHFDFGGLPLLALEIEHGASDPSIDFSYPNPREMSRMKLRVDTGPVQVENLANANAVEIRLKGEGTCYRLNFGGELKRSCLLHIGMVVARVEVALPAGTAVKVTGLDAPTSSLADDFSYAEKVGRSEWATQNASGLVSKKAFWNGAAQEQPEPLLSIHNTSNSALHIRYTGKPDIRV